jgi:hypothetical protein
MFSGSTYPYSAGSSMEWMVTMMAVVVELLGWRISLVVGSNAEAFEESDVMFSSARRTAQIIYPRDVRTQLQTSLSENLLMAWCRSGAQYEMRHGRSSTDVTGGRHNFWPAGCSFFG